MQVKVVTFDKKVSPFTFLRKHSLHSNWDVSMHFSLVN